MAIPNIGGCIAVVGLATSDRHFSKFEVEMWDESHSVLKASSKLIDGYYDEATQLWKQKEPVYFEALLVGTRFAFRVRVHSAGGTKSAWSAIPEQEQGWVYDEAGDLFPIVATYPNPIIMVNGDTVHIELNAYIDPNDPLNNGFAFFELLQTIDQTAPNIATRGLNIKDGIADIPTTASGQQWLWARPVDINGNLQEWTCFGSYIPPEDAAAFVETFDNPIFWDVHVGTTLSETYPANGISGGKVYNNGGKYVWMSYPGNIPFDPEKMYKIRCTARKVSGSDHPVYFGVLGVAADGTTLVSIAGANDFHNPHWLCAANEVVTSDWTEYVGYFRGKASVGDDGSGLPSTDVATPAKLHNDVRYIRPMMALSYNTDGCVLEVDTFDITVVPSLDDVPDGSARRSRTAVHSRYSPTQPPLVASAVAGGTSGKITIHPFVMQCGSDTINCLSADYQITTGIVQGQKYFVYYDDPDFLGGEITPQATQDEQQLLANSGRFTIGEVTVPFIGGGGGSVPTNVPQRYLDGGEISTINPVAAADSNPTTAALVNSDYDSEFLTPLMAQCTWYGFTAQAGSHSSVTLKLTTGASGNTGASYLLEYSVDNGGSWTTVYSGTSSRGNSTDSIILSTSQDLTLVQVRATANSSISGALSSIRVYDIHVEVT